MDVSKITVKAKRRITKFAEGADPGKDQPFEVIEKEDVFTGQEALNLLDQLGIKKEDVIDGTN